PKLQTKQKNGANKASQKALQVLIRKIKEGKDYETKIIYLEEKLNKTKEQLEQLNSHRL
ncbi:24883_t:CDS:2, partial [Dentiscutata erythropus]